MTFGIFILCVLCIWLILHIALVFSTSRMDAEYYKKRDDRLNKKYYDDYKRKHYPKLCAFYNNIDFWCNLTSTIVVIVLFFFLMFTAGGQYASTSFVKQYESVKADFAVREESFNEIERAAIFTKATEMNARLAALKFQNEVCFGIFDTFVTDDINKLQPIR